MNNWRKKLQVSLAISNESGYTTFDDYLQMAVLEFSVRTGENGVEWNETAKDGNGIDYQHL